MLLVERKEPTVMYPSDLLTELRQQDFATALRQAEQARLVRLTRTDVMPIQQRQAAHQHQVKTHWWLKTASALKHAGAFATNSCLSTPCSGTPSCVCSL